MFLLKRGFEPRFAWSEATSPHPLASRRYKKMTHKGYFLLKKRGIYFLVLDMAVILILFASFTREDGTEGLEENFNISCDTPVIDVETVEADDFFEISDLTTAGDLPEAGNTWFDTDTTLMVGRILIIFINSWRASTN